MSVSIDAKLVMELRRLSGAGMMECKKVLGLPHVQGDLELAMTELRKTGQTKADKKADRITAEGMMVAARRDDGHFALLVEINSETDFVARDENFKQFAHDVADVALRHEVADIAVLANTMIPSRQMTVEEARQALIGKIGENIQIRRIETLSSTGSVGTYLHGSRIGVLVALNQVNEILAKDLAMHIAACKPMVVRREDVPASAIDYEREIFMAQASESGKPADIVSKMVEGRITKYVDEVSLLGQSFVKDPNKKVAQLLKEHGAEVLQFMRLEVGEGIEKKEDNFVEEVMAQVRDQ